MQRQAALVLAIVFFVIFGFLAYYGAKITLWASIVFGLFISLILLNVFYPPGQATSDDADFTLVLYALFEIIGVVILAVYILEGTLNDVRRLCCKN